MICVCGNTCHGTCVEVKGQHSGVASLCPALCGFCGSNSGCQAYRSILQARSMSDFCNVVIPEFLSTLPVTANTPQICQAKVSPSVLRLNISENPVSLSEVGGGMCPILHLANDFLVGLLVIFFGNNPSFSYIACSLLSY